MSVYDERPWVEFYDDWVKPEIEVPDKTYVDLIEEVFADFPDRAALHFMGATITFGELDRLSRQFATFLIENGVEKGSVVGINLPNIPQYPIAHLGALRAGCIANGVSPLMTPKEMAYQLNDCGAKVLVTLDAIFEERVTKMHDKAPNLSHVVAANVADFMPGLKRILGKLLGKVPSGKVSELPDKTVFRFGDVLAMYPPKAPKVEIGKDDTCLIQYTGGTTGMPKGVEITNYNYAANFTQFLNWFDYERGQDVVLSGFPFFHLAGLGTCMGSMALGNTQVLIPDPRNTKHIINEFRKYKPNAMNNVPSLYMMLMNDPEFRELDFSCLKACLSGAAPFAVEALTEFNGMVGEGKLVEVYGMTETSPLMTMNPYQGKKKIGSVGLPIQSTRIKLVDLDTGKNEVPLGEEGELICNGPQVMKGYLNKPEETDHAIRDFQGEKWLYTGDVAKMDEDGFFYIVDRAKDMLNVGGYKVFSREVEESLYEYAAIEACAIVGVARPDRPGSETVKAIIQLSAKYKDKDREGVESEIMAYCKENMAPYKIPKTIEFVDDIPLTPIGKVDKKALR